MWLDGAVMIHVQCMNLLVALLKLMNPLDPLTAKKHASELTTAKIAVRKSMFKTKTHKLYSLDRLTFNA